MHDDLEFDDGNLDERTLALQAHVDRVTGQHCRRCNGPLCGHQALLAIVFGCRQAPRCARCLAEEHAEDQPALLRRALEWIRRRDCYYHIWRRAGEREGYGAVDEPGCLCFGSAQATVAPPAATSPPTADASYDAGDLGCGDLVLELRFRFADLPPGAVLHVTARDLAAPIDLPAWCGLCGHTLRHAAHPHYWIQRKRDRS